MRADAGGDPSIFAECLRELARLAAARRTPFESVPGRLARHATEEALAPVRENGLRALVRKYPNHAATGRAAAECLSDPDPSVRFVAALGSGATGVPVLAALAADEFASAAQRTRAIRALASKGDAAAETPLLRALTTPLGSSAVAIVRALGRVGTVRAVAPLRSVVPRTSDPIRSAALEAIASIQSRIEGGGHGSLSVASVAGGAAGALALSSDAGRLELAPPGETATAPTAAE